MAESGDLEDEDLELPEEEEDEEVVTRCYFFRRFEYKEIRLFLFKNHGAMNCESIWLKFIVAVAVPSIIWARVVIFSMCLS